VAILKAANEALRVVYLPQGRVASLEYADLWVVVGQV
jgi:hypothetical protein